MVDRIIAVVNTELITLSELKSEIEPEEKRLQAQYRGPDLQRRLQQLEYTGLTRMIERKLQMQIAQKKGVEVTDEEVKRAAQELQRQGEKVDDSSPDDQKHIREQLTLLKVVDREVRSGVMISEVEMQRYFESHMNRFALPAEYRLSQILIVPRSTETQAGGRKRAASAHEALKKGADFSDVALRFSDGPESTRGGNLGVVRQGELLPQIERAVAQLEPGQATEPIETSQGWHIIRLEEKKPPQFRPFAEVKNEIQNLVYQQKTEDVYRIWMAELKNKSHIDVRF
jgi:peptidyl-prolyl cis-trans isomerase SurA